MEYLLDARLFDSIQSGPPDAAGVTEAGENHPIYRLGVWRYQGRISQGGRLRYEIQMPMDLAYAWIRADLEWMNVLRRQMKLMIDKKMVFSMILDVIGPRVVTDFYCTFYYRNWALHGKSLM